MNEQIFKFSESFEFPAYQLKTGDWIFLGSLVVVKCELTDESNASRYLKDELPGKWRQEFKIPGKKGRPALYVTEPGLYYLISQAKTDLGLWFRDKIFEEVLPSIRKAGTYKSPDMTFDQKLNSVVEDIRAIASSPELCRNIEQAQSEELRLLGQGKLMSAEERGRILAQGLTPLQLKQLRLKRLLPEIEQIVQIDSGDEKNA